MAGQHRVLADDRDRLRGRDVVAGVPITIVQNSVEVFSDKLFPARESVAATH
jgi:hypothetical protein